MSLEQHVTSLELSKKLKELGVPQGGVFGYYENTFHPEHPFIVLTSTFPRIENPANWICSAFLASELGEMLPLFLFDKDGRECDLHIWPQSKRTGIKGWSIYYSGASGGVHAAIFEESEADARAKMLIHLLEEGLLKI